MFLSSKNICRNFFIYIELLPWKTSDRCASCGWCLKGNAGVNPEQFPATVSGALRNDVTGANWEGALGDEAKPGDLPVTKTVKPAGETGWFLDLYIFLPLLVGGFLFRREVT